MAEQIKIFELDIDVDAAIKSQSILKKELNGSKDLLDRLKKSGDTSSDTYVKLAAETKNLSKEYNASQTQLGKLLNLQGKQITTVEQGRNALTIINKEWSKSASLYGVNSKEADKLAKKHLELKNRVNELQKGVGDTSGNIGNYSKDMQEAIGKTTIFGRIQSSVSNVLGLITPIYKYVRTEIRGIRNDYIQATAATKGFSRAQKASAIGTNLVSAALKLFKVALISTGIGAIVVLLGSLVAWFAKTQEGIDFVNKTLNIFGTAINVVIDRLSTIGGAFIKFLSGDVKGGFNDIKDAISGVGAEMKKEIKITNDLENAKVSLRKKEIGLIETHAVRRKKIEELRLSAKNELTSLKDRAKFLEKAGNLEKSILKDNIEVAKEKARISQADLELGKSTDAQIKETAQLKADVIAKETESLKKQRSIEAEKQGLLKRARSEEATALKERIANSKKLIDAAIKENKTLLKLYQERNKGEKDTLFESIDFAAIVRDKKLAILKQEIEAGKKTKAEAELESLQIKNEYLDREKELIIEYAEEELRIFKEATQSRIEQGQFLTDILVSQEIERLQLIAEKEREFQRQRLEEGVISQKQYNEAIAQVDAEYKASKDELELQQKEQKAEADAIDFENEQVLRIERDGLIFEAQLLDLERSKKAEIEAAEKVGADTTKIEEKYKIYKEQIKQAEKDSKLNIQKELFGGVAELLGKETVAGKAAGIASATINTYQGVSEVWRAKSVLPEPFGTAAKVVSTGVVLGSGLKAVKKIASTKADVPKAARGITLQGNRHSGGGIDLFDGNGQPVLNAEDGENMYVINRRASALINGLSSINELTGGVPLSTSTNFAMAGGLIQRSIQSTQSGKPIVFKSEPINYDLMAQKIGEANQQLPNPKTDVEDIINAVSNYNQVVNGANI